MPCPFLDRRGEHGCNSSPSFDDGEPAFALHRRSGCSGHRSYSSGVACVHGALHAHCVPVTRRYGLWEPLPIQRTSRTLVIRRKLRGESLGAPRSPPTPSDRSASNKPIQGRNIGITSVLFLHEHLPFNQRQSLWLSSIRHIAHDRLLSFEEILYICAHRFSFHNFRKTNGRTDKWIKASGVISLIEHNFDHASCAQQNTRRAGLWLRGMISGRGCGC